MNGKVLTTRLWTINGLPVESSQTPVRSQMISTPTLVSFATPETRPPRALSARKLEAQEIREELFFRQFESKKHMNWCSQTSIINRNPFDRTTYRSRVTVVGHDRLNCNNRTQENHIYNGDHLKALKVGYVRAITEARL